MEGLKLSGVILRASLDDGFILADLHTDSPIEKNLPSVRAALDAALRLGASEVWQQNVDKRGRPLGQPFKLVPFSAWPDNPTTELA